MVISTALLHWFVARAGGCWGRAHSSSSTQLLTAARVDTGAGTRHLLVTSGLEFMVNISFSRSIIESAWNITSGNGHLVIISTALVCTASWRLSAEQLLVLQVVSWGFMLSTSFRTQEVNFMTINRNHSKWGVHYPDWLQSVAMPGSP